MKNVSLSRRVFIGIGAVIGMFGLAGCGGGSGSSGSSSNSGGILLTSVSNGLNIDNQTVTGSVSGSRATISGNGEKSFQFNDISLPSSSLLKKIVATQELDKSVTVTVPAGKSLPTSFTLSNIALSVVISDTKTNTDGSSSTREFTAPLTITGSVTYTQVNSTNVYAASGNPSFVQLVIDGDKLTQFRNIVSTSPTPNTVKLKISFDTDDTALPKDSTIEFKSVNGVAKLYI